VLDGMDIHAGPQLGGESLLARPLDDLGDREVRPVRLLAVEKGGRYPDLIGYLCGLPDFTGSFASSWTRDTIYEG
jgi:hypothetical protein